jgi:hypothetical protein
LAGFVSVIGRGVLDGLEAPLNDRENIMDVPFPPALLACISEDRDPDAGELRMVTDKVCREAFPDELLSNVFERAGSIARVAMTGGKDHL